jgi:Electron transfer DM13
MPQAADKFSKRRTVWSALALIVLFGLWYAFRPEKLFVNKRVVEPQPLALGQLTPIYTGSFHSDARETRGRATVYQQPNDSRVLTLSNFLTSNGPVLEVILLDGSSVANGQDLTAGSDNNRDLGELKNYQGEQSYALPADVDFNRFNTVAIYSHSLHVVFGTAKLEVF